MDTAVGLVKAYLELCGYFVLAELPVRAFRRDRIRDVTDLDIPAVLFPHVPVAAPRPVSRPLDVFLGADPELTTTEEGMHVVIGEVKEGRARLNPALAREQTVAFALRRIGCCPETQVAAEARAVASEGHRKMAMPGHTACQVQLVAFAGHGASEAWGVKTISLAHCAEFIATRLRSSQDVLSGVQFKDTTLGFFALQQKLAAHHGLTGRPNPWSEE